MQHYPRPPRRPQGYRVRFAGRRGARPWHGGSTWVFCLAALALVAGLVALDPGRRAAAAPAPAAPVAPAPARDGVQLHRWSPTGQPLSLPAPRIGPHENPPHGAREGPSSWDDRRATDDAPHAEPAHDPGDRAASADISSLPPPAPSASGRGLGARPPAAAAVRTATAEHASAPIRAAARDSRKLVVQLTAYSASVEEGTAWRITRSGTRVRPGVVAVDPTVIPLGSHLRIAGLPGIFRAEDTGSGVRGAHVDVYLESRAAAFQFGRRPNVLVEVLD